MLIQVKHRFLAKLLTDSSVIYFDYGRAKTHQVWSRALHGGVRWTLNRHAVIMTVTTLIQMQSFWTRTAEHIESKGCISFTQSACSRGLPANLLSPNAAEGSQLSQNHSGFIWLNRLPCFPQVPAQTARHKIQIFPLKTAHADTAADRQSEATETDCLPPSCRQLTLERDPKGILHPSSVPSSVLW